MLRLILNIKTKTFNSSTGTKYNKNNNKQTSQIEENHETITDGTKSGASHAVMPVVVGVAIATVGVGTGIFVKRHLQRRG